MRISYDAEVDALYILFAEAGGVHGKELEDGVIADLDKNDRIIGLQVLNASKRFGPSVAEVVVEWGGGPLPKRRVRRFPPVAAKTRSARD